MKGVADLEAVLKRIDGSGWRAFRDLRGAWDFGDFVLVVDHVQGDPYASPSHLRLELALEDLGLAGFPVGNAPRRRAAEDFLLRRCHRALSRLRPPRVGAAKGGEIRFQKPGQEVLDRNGIVLSSAGLDLRFFFGLPGHGRRVAGREARDMLCRWLPDFVAEAFLDADLDEAGLGAHCDCVEDQVSLREQLARRGLVAFVADGSLLPRASGVDDRPLDREKAVLFRSPPTWRVELEAPHGGLLRGMGIPEGVTLLVGGGYHGKSTLLRAIERGVWDHVPGDGREGVVTVADAVKVRAEDGRSVAGVDISPFIGWLPSGEDTRTFRSENASGSTSQAANIIEALEAGSSLLLLDEDTSATNFMIRDSWMRRLVPDEREPITPFVDRVRALHRDRGVSTILVVGGAGDYLRVADGVLLLDSYEPHDVSERAGEIARDMGERNGRDEREPFPATEGRLVDPVSFDGRKGRKELFVRERGGRTLVLGEKEIDLSLVEQVVDPDQITAMGHALARLSHAPVGAMAMAELLERIEAELHAEGLDALNPWPGRHPGTFMSRFRPLELAGAVNRLRGLRVRGPR